MIKIKEINTYLNEVAPYSLQEGYDNAGHLIGDPEMECTGVITCLDSTEAVIDEAIEMGCNLVIAHHPIVFRGLKRFTGSNYIERVVMKAIKNDIAIIASHTNLDNVLQDGVNGKIAEKLGLIKTQPLLKKEVEIPGVIGSGVIGELASEMKAMDFLKFLKETMQVSVVKYTSILEDSIKKVAVCGGAGGFLLNEAIRQNADVFITGDYKYHEFFDADGHLIIADIGHFESEQFTINLLHDIISRKFSTFAAHCTKVNTNPVNYL